MVVNMNQNLQGQNITTPAPTQPSVPGATPVGALSHPEDSIYTQKASNRPKTIGAAIAIIIIILIAAALLANFNKGGTTNAPAALLIDQYNGLYGIPNQSFLSTVYSSGYPSPNSTSAIINVYGASFTAPFINSMNATVLNVPASYSNYTAPFLILEIASYSANQNVALASYNSILGSVTAPGSFANSAGLNFSSSAYQIGTSAVVYSSDPYNVKLQGITFLDGGYVVQINTYGNIGKFNSSYAINLANHIISVIAK